MLGSSVPGTEGSWIEEPGHGEERVANRLGLQSPRCPSPEPSVVGIEGHSFLVRFNALPINSAGYDQTMKPFQLPTVLNQIHRQPVEQFRMCRPLALNSKIAGRGDNALTEMMMPNRLTMTRAAKCPAPCSGSVIQRANAARRKLVRVHPSGGSILPVVRLSAHSASGRRGSLVPRFPPFDARPHASVHGFLDSDADSLDHRHGARSGENPSLVTCTLTGSRFPS
jgi:hypothetical protein